jgi:hypothetical protein
MVISLLVRSARGLWHPRFVLLMATVLFMLVLSSTETAVPGPGVERAEAAYRFGSENSWIRVQNIGDERSTVEVAYYDEAGQLKAKDYCPTWAVCPYLEPGEGWTFFQRDNPWLPRGFQGSAVVTTDQPAVAVMAKDVIRYSGAFLSAGDTMSATSGSSTLYLPLTASRDGPFQDWNGRFAIQNLSETVTACVTITYLSNYTDSEIHWDPYDPDMRNPRRQAGCPDGGMPLKPRGTIFRDPDTMGVPAKFTGSVRIETHENSQGVPPDQQFLSATADTWNSLFPPFASYRGLDESELGTTIILPLVDREVGPLNQWSTHFQIVNKDPENPAKVTLRFEGWDLSQNPPQFVVKQNQLTVRGARMCFQDRNDHANCLAAGDRLPSNFVGTVRLTSTRPIAAVVNRSAKFSDTFTNYRGVRPQDGARRVLLPVLNRNFGPVGDRHGWNSWFRVMVADGGSANVTVRYFGRDLPNGTVAYTRHVFREFTVFQYLDPVLPDGFAGTAIIESDRPIVALADLTTDVFFGDTDFLYNGISLD